MRLHEYLIMLLRCTLNIKMSPMSLQRIEIERTLTDPQRDDLEDMLRALTLERSQIKEAMAFALDNADAAGEVNFNTVPFPFLILYFIYLELRSRQLSPVKRR